MAEMDRQRGERIRDLRDAHAWTQRQLADRLDVDPKTVHNWEAGKELNPTNLRELAELLDVSMDYIRFGERGSPDLTDMLGAAETQLDRIESNQEKILAELAALTSLVTQSQATLPTKRRAGRSQPEIQAKTSQSRPSR